MIGFYDLRIQLHIFFLTQIGVKFANYGTAVLDMEGLTLAHIWLPGLNIYKVT